MRRRWWSALGLALLAGQVAWGALRVPGRVYDRRLQDIAAHRSRGAVGWFLEQSHMGGAEAVRWILQHVPPDGVVLWRGQTKGALEFVPYLIAPRLLVAEGAAAAGWTYAGRPLATRPGEDGTPAVVVLEGLGADLRLVPR